MKTDYYIDVNRKLTKAQDFEFLRTEGLKHIEALAHELWTDFNAHDPGITILEVLSYAISELGYRANFDIQDLLANEDNTINNATFFTARDILTNAPLTILDYRKILIDIEGVNNAWVITKKNKLDSSGYPLPLDNEIPIYINKKEDKLSVSDQDTNGNDLEKLTLRGLNQVIVELSDDDQLGQLNLVAVDYAWPTDNRYVEVEIKMEFKSWNDPESDWLRLMREADKINLEDKEAGVDQLKILVHSKNDPTQKLQLYINAYDPSEMANIEDYFNDLNNVALVIEKFYEKKVKVSKINQEIANKIHENRNLGEDWLCTETIQSIEIGVCADIEVATNGDAEAILAKIQQAIDNILCPPIRFYTLKQLLAKKISASDIFNGPKLEHGFLMDDEVKSSQLPDCIHVSDIISALMDIEGVEAVDNMMLTAYDSNGNPIEGQSNEKWCLHLNGQVKPDFNPKRSKLLLFRDGIPFMIPEKGAFELSQGIQFLKAENNTYKLKETEKDLKIPKGNYYQLDEYYSIQNDFPATYGIGNGELRLSVSDLRKAQAKQLKAYLLHFDQVLADYFSQLYNAKNLFDLQRRNPDPTVTPIDPNYYIPIDKTYHHQYLMTIPGIEENKFYKEAYTPTYVTDIEGDEFNQNRAMYEDKTTFYDRRNRILDHLLARFGESFNDYVLMMYSVQQNANGMAEMTFQKDELIEDKITFLKQYPKVSSKRGLGINYLQQESLGHSWGIEHRAGFIRRVIALLGIDRSDLGSIVSFEGPVINWEYDTEIGLLKFKLLIDPTSENWDKAHKLIHDAGALHIRKKTVKYYISFSDNAGELFAELNKSFSSELEAKDFIPKFYRALNGYLESLYCIEHILLRPLVNEGHADDDLLTVCLNDDCYSEASNDPYSFKITVVLPGWLSRFRNRYFRRYAENLIRNEAPAHTLIKICWVSRTDMIAFQKAYKIWLKAFKNLRLNYCSGGLTSKAQIEYVQALSGFVESIKALNTIYDAGTLHDCIESELSNPIVLNNSSLGTL